MIIDFHVHGKIKSSFSFDKKEFLQKVNEAKEYGLDSIAIVEHCRAKNFLEGYEFLSANYKQIKDYYDIDGIKVFYGMEVTTKQDLDILFIGNANLVLNLRENICKVKGTGYIDINKLFEIYIPEEILVILAHPYREHKTFPDIENHVVNRIDAVEINSKDIYKQGMNETREKVLKLAKNFKKPIVCGSDTHYFIQISTAKNILSKDCITVKDIKEEIKLGNYNVEFSSDLNARVKSAIIIKDLICKQ